MKLREEALSIVKEAIHASLPDTATKRALREIDCSQGKTIVVSIGKAGWQMAAAAAETLQGRFEAGYVITKYGHSEGPIGKFRIFEAAHPILDQNAVDATEVILKAVENLTEEDRVLLLLSGGGSALFEKPLIPLSELSELTNQLLACGADIVEINTIRKRLSAVKGGKFAQACMPAQVYSIILSDIVGDRPDMIASGPAYPDNSTCEEAGAILEKYEIVLPDALMKLLEHEPLKVLPNVHTVVTGGVSRLCEFAKEACERRGYKTQILTDRLCCEAREAGSFLGSAAAYCAEKQEKFALIAGGETIVHVTGKGMGGRNQEIALAAAEQIAGLDHVVVLSVGSDGTDGPTDAAGGIVDGSSAGQLAGRGLKIYEILKNNDAYHGLEACGGLIKTGATGTNVNDLSMILISGER